MKIKDRKVVFSKKEAEGIEKIQIETKDMPENLSTWKFRADRIAEIMKK